MRQAPVAIIHDVAEVRVHRLVINPRLWVFDRGNDCAYSLGVRVARQFLQYWLIGRRWPGLVVLALDCLVSRLLWPLRPGLACDPCGGLNHTFMAVVNSRGALAASPEPPLAAGELTAIVPAGPELLSVGGSKHLEEYTF